MPGHIDNEDPKADYLTDFSLYGSITGGDPVVLANLTPIDLRKSVTAARNRILLVPRKTSGAGAGTTKFKLHAKLSGTLDAVFILVAETTSFGAADKLVRFENLPAGIYVIETVVETTPDVVAVHVSHNDLTGVL